MENGSLLDIIDQYGVFPEDITSTYVNQILKALQFLHEKNIIHRVSQKLFC